jgi:hypothetical protein
VSAVVATVRPAIATTLWCSYLSTDGATKCSAFEPTIKLSFNAAELAAIHATFFATKQTAILCTNFTTHGAANCATDQST